MKGKGEWAGRENGPVSTDLTHFNSLKFALKYTIVTIIKHFPTYFTHVINGYS